MKKRESKWKRNFFNLAAIIFSKALHLKVGSWWSRKLEGEGRKDKRNLSLIQNLGNN